MNKKLRWVAVMAAFLFACSPGESSEQETANAQSSGNSLTVQQVINKHSCNQCHRPDSRLVGPSYIDIASKGYSEEELIELIRKPKPDNWPGYMPMIGIKISDEEGKLISEYINSLEN